MSTTFAVIHEEKEIEIARRVGVGNGKVKVFFIDPLAEFLSDKTKVVAIDNSQQGINTIGDLKKHINETNGVA